MNALCQQQKNLSDKIVIAFMKKMWNPNLVEKTDFYWIAWDPTGTVEIYDTYWSLSDMYSVLEKDYPKEDIWSWYWYTLENCDDIIWYLNLDYFCTVYKGYKWNLSDIYKREVEARNKNTTYWNSLEWKAESDRKFKESADKFLTEVLWEKKSAIN